MPEDSRRIVRILSIVFMLPPLGNILLIGATFFDGSFESISLGLPLNEMGILEIGLFLTIQILLVFAGLKLWNLQRTGGSVFLFAFVLFVVLIGVTYWRNDSFYIFYVTWVAFMGLAAIYFITQTRRGVLK